MLGILLTIHVLVTIFLILIVLIQKSEGGSSLFASGSGTGMFSARGTSNALTKATWILASIFLGNCLLMSHISAVNIKQTRTIVGATTTLPISPKKNKSEADQAPQKIGTPKTQGQETQPAQKGKASPQSKPANSAKSEGPRQ